MQTSLKDKGNSYFKQKKYQQAIKCYEQYVQQFHQDNYKVYFSLGLCFQFKKQHEKALQFFRNAISEQNGYEKPFYKLMKKYKELSDNKDQYNIFINAYKFLKYSKAGDYQNQRKQAQKQLNNSKKGLCENASVETWSKGSPDLFQILQKTIPKIQQSQNFNIQFDKQINQWINQWNQNVQSDDAKWEEIKYSIEENYQYGINLAYFYINQVSNRTEKDRICRELKQIKKQNSLHTPVNAQNNDNFGESDVNEGLVKTNKDNKSDQSYLGIKRDELKRQKQLNKKIQYFSSLPKVKQTKQEQLAAKKDLQAKMQLSKNIITEIKENSIVIPENASIETIYTAYCKNLETSKKLFDQAYKSIVKILSGNQNSQTKGQLLILLKKRLKKFKLIINSFSENEQSNIYNLLVKNKIQQYAIDFAPNFNKL